jgi:hypothetical protein
MVPFTVTFDPSLVGTTQTITASVDPGNALNESNFSNNTASVTVDVMSLKLSVMVDGTQMSDTASNAVPMPPSVISRPGYNLTQFESVKDILISCVDANNKTQVGCSYTVTLSSGPSNGGHAHGGGTRPLVCAQSDCTNSEDILVSGQSETFDESGADLTYAAPEISGDVQLVITGKGPAPGYLPLQGPTIVFNVESMLNLGPLTAEGFSVVTDSHPDAGIYATQAMQMAVGNMMTNYFSYTASVGILSADSVRSEALTAVFSTPIGMEEAVMPQLLGFLLTEGIGMVKRSISL